MKFSKRQLFQRRATRAEEAKETRGCNEREKRVVSIASHISFRLKERMPIRLEGNKVGWKSDRVKGKSEEGKRWFSFYFLATK